jgi:hypothetical protein
MKTTNEPAAANQNLAAAQGDAKGRRNTTMLELLLSPEEIEYGKRRAQA